MSEDERALKAARAKAMLKKRQQKKTAGPSTTNGPSSPLISPPISRAFSPAPSEPAEDEKKDIADVFTPTDSDTSWVTSLPRVGSPVPPAGVFPPFPAVPAPGISQTRPSPSVSTPDDRQILLQNQQQTISLLVSEKANLTAELERLERLGSKALETETLLAEEQSKAKELQGRVHQLQASVAESADQIRELQSTEKVLTERCRDQERELQLTNSNLKNLRAEAEQHQRRVRYLEEQIQSDDRVEKLESSLKNKQDRAEELEFRLSKIKQEHATFKTDREQAESRLRTLQNDLDEWQAKHSALFEKYSASEGQLASASGERDALLREKLALQARISSDEKTSAMLQEKLNQAASELLACTRQLQSVQAELRHANRRADDAEKLQKDLQVEGTSLLHSVDEMRPKIVELTGAKLELTEQVDGLQHALRDRDAAIAELESTVEEMQKKKDEADQQWRETLARREAERASAQASSTDFQTAFSELQADLDASRASVLALEADRANYQQQADHQFEEINRLTASSQENWEEITTLRRELDERRSAQDEEQGFLERAQNEIESLRSEISSRDEEIERLRNAVASPPLSSGAPRSLDDELLNSAQQQHVLDLSTLQSKNRELETAIFDADAKVHALQKQVRSLETQLAQTTSAARAELSPSIPSRPSSRNVDHTDLRRASFHSRKSSGGLPPPTRSIIDIGLSPDARHKRQISLSMLKARIDSEMAASSVGNHPPPSRGLSPTAPLPTVREPSSSPPLLAHAPSHRPQILDEAHVFWCHSCHGDLVVL